MSSQDIISSLLNFIYNNREIISSLNSIILNEKYAELMKSLCNLTDECRKLVVDAECHIKSIKEQAQDDSGAIENLKQAFINSSNVSGQLNEIKSSVMESLQESKTLCQRYDEIIKNLNKYCGQAKAECIRNESIAGIAGKGMIAGAFGGLGICGAHVGYQMGTVPLFAFRPACAVGGGVFTILVGGFFIRKVFQESAKQFNVLVKGLRESIEVLCIHLKAMKEHDKQLGKLGKLSETLWARCNAFDEQEPEERDKMNNEFILEKFDRLKRAHNDLKENCDNVLSQFDTYAIDICNLIEIFVA